MRRIITFILSLLCVVYCYADYVNRGRPLRDHESPFEAVFMVIGLIVLVIFGGAWLVCKVQENKDAIGNAVGAIICLGMLFGAILLVAKCGEGVYDSRASRQSRSTTTPNDLSSPNTNQTQPQVQPTYQKHSPTLKYRTVEYYENCSYCDGRGKVVCTECGGSGWKEKTCTYCHGKGDFGRSTCFDCHGKGYTEDLVFGGGQSKCFRCNGTGYINKTCTLCSGSGKTREICDWDASAYYKTHYVTCSHCNGNGKIIRTRQESYYE